MSFATYSTLLTTVANFLSRGDLTSSIPDFVTLAQLKINREVRVEVMETKNAAFSIANEYENVPTDFLAVKTFYLTSTTPDLTLEYLPADSATKYGSATDKPRYFTVASSQFRFAPVPDATYTATLVYYALPATLATTTQETNTLFPKYADLFLYASLLAAEAFIQDDPRLPMWKAAYDDALASVNGSSRRSRHGGALVTRPDSSTP